MSDQTQKYESGSVRSADANHLDFTSIPLVGLIAVARTSAEGAEKYGRLNYMKGMPVHDLLNHAMRHQVMHLLGDRSEPHLAHAAWNILAAIQSQTLDPHLSAPHMLGPGATLTEAAKGHLAMNEDRLSKLRASGAFAHSGEWSLSDLPEIREIIGQRVEELGFDSDF